MKWIPVLLLILSLSAVAQPKIVLGPVNLPDSSSVTISSPVEFSDTTTNHRMFLMVTKASSSTRLNFRIMTVVQRGALAPLDTTTHYTTPSTWISNDTLISIATVSNLTLKKSWFPTVTVAPADSIIVYEFIEAASGWKYTWIIKPYDDNVSGGADVVLLER